MLIFGPNIKEIKVEELFLDESEEVRKEFVDTFGKGKFFGELLI
ncbi:hypothetical protein [Caldisericum sp.]